MKKIFILILGLLTFTNLLNAQSFDAIIKKDGTTIQGKVLKVTDEAIEFDPKGEVPFLIIKRTDVESILYSNGTLVKLSEIIGLVNNTNDNEKESSLLKNLNFVDKNGYQVKELLIIDLVLSCSDLSITRRTGNNNSIEIYSNEKTNNAYKINITSHWLSQTGKAKGLFTRPRIYFSELNFTISILKEGKVVFSQNFTEPIFSIQIIRMLLQGKEQTDKQKIIDPVYTIENNSFSYGGVLFKPNVRFSDGTFVWEPNTRIGDAYQTYKVTFKILLQ